MRPCLASIGSSLVGISSAGAVSRTVRRFLLAMAPDYACRL